ncbi:hypothetical protein [Thermonema rossianum]|uniref:hypothetical protein n=1 Tax=Thermonema rossianum TaxID=55505 RepID=UPI0005705295|nr:hypothetical protein [Thermonema rossianum]
MKKMLQLLLVLLVIAGGAQAQKMGVKVLNEEEVPAEVKATHDRLFPGVKVIRWEGHKWVNKNDKERGKIVAVFDYEGVRTRARYRPNGKALSASSYYKADQLPASVASAAARYEGFELKGGSKTWSLKDTSKAPVYKLRLRKGAQVLSVFVDEQGNEIEKNKLSEELQEDEE